MSFCPRGITRGCQCHAGYYFEDDELTGCRCGDPLLKLSHRQHVDRSLAVERGLTTPKVVGSNGLSVFVRDIDYFDYNNGFLLPTYHTFHYGVVKEFLRKLFAARANCSDILVGIPICRLFTTSYEHDYIPVQVVLRTRSVSFRSVDFSLGHTYPQW